MAHFVAKGKELVALDRRIVAQQNDFVAQHSGIVAVLSVSAPQQKAGILHRNELAAKNYAAPRQQDHLLDSMPAALVLADAFVDQQPMVDVGLFH